MPSGLSQSHQEIAGQFQWELLQLICLGSGGQRVQRPLGRRMALFRGSGAPPSAFAACALARRFKAFDTCFFRSETCSRVRLDLVSSAEARRAMMRYDSASVNFAPFVHRSAAVPALDPPL